VRAGLRSRGPARFFFVGLSLRYLRPGALRLARGRGVTIMGPRWNFPFYQLGSSLWRHRSRPDTDDDAQIGVATKTRAKPKKPSQYKVLLLNDDYTPMEFVVIVLKRFFRMDMEEATRVMLHVHQRGVGVCGIFPYEVAETKVNQVMDFAKANQHPLQCTLEKA